MRDVVGKRFNGYHMQQPLARMGWRSEMLVLDKRSEDPAIHGHGRWGAHAELGLFAAERVSSLQGLLSPIALSFPLRACFRRADLAHWHLTFPHYISLPLLPWLSRQKPTLWSLHDPWPMTGHCIHPMECMRWQTGCGSCPDLNRNFTVWFDTTRLVWKAKQIAYRRSALTLVVGSRWMKSLVDASPLLSGFPCHLVPYGLDLNVWKRHDKAESRAKLGIPAHAKVLAFRMPRGRRQKVAKGIPWLIEALHRLEVREPIVLLVFEEPGQLAELAGKYTIIEYDWAGDEAWIAAALSAADIFVTPSLGESAGIMSLESMACGVPVITSNTTAMPETIRAPEAGIALPPKNAEALAAAIAELLAADGQRAAMGAAGRRIVEEQHSLDHHVAQHVTIYEDMLRRAAAEEMSV